MSAPKWTNAGLDRLAVNYQVHSPFNIAHFNALRKTALLGHALTCVQRIPSTQTLAHELARNGAPTGTLVIADEQTQGIGRNNRSWSSSPQGNVYLSLIIRAKNLMEALKLNLGAGIAVCRTARAFGARSAGVKWPNDVWCGDKKLSGVLVDSDTDYLVVGIGVSVVSIPIPIPTPPHPPSPFSSLISYRFPSPLSSLSP